MLPIESMTMIIISAPFSVASRVTSSPWCLSRALYGAVREADEGTRAPIFQLLMATQMPIIAFFAIKWLPRAPPGACGRRMASGSRTHSSRAVFHFKL